MWSITNDTAGPLRGLRVLDVGMLFAGPMVATNLSDLGADVIKIEHPTGCDVRKTGRFKDGEPLWWRVVSRNKRLVAVDMKRPEGVEIVRRLASHSDVMIENFRPGRLKHWGLDYATLSRANAGLILLHISGYGQTGPYCRRPGMGTLAEAFSGFAEVTGEPDRPPSLPQFPLADGVAAMMGAYAVLAALYNREKNDGKGDEIDLSLYEPMLSLLGPMVIDYDQLGYIAHRHGNRSSWSVPRNTYKTKDGKWIAVSSAANSVARRLFRAIGRADLADDPTLATNPLRVKRIDECDGIIAKWVSERTQQEALTIFDEFEVVAGPIYDVAQLTADEHVQHRETIVDLDDERLARIRMQNVVPRFARNPGKVRWPGKSAIGSDTTAVLTELGYSRDDVLQLRSEGVVEIGETQES